MGSGRGAGVTASDYSQRLPVVQDDDLGALSASFNRMQAGLAERRRLHAAFGTYVDPALAAHLLEQDDDVFTGERREVTVMFIDIRDSQYAIDGPVILGPELPPEDSSCGQFAVQFHVTTTTVVGLKRIAEARRVSVPELCRQVVGGFVAQQEGELGALLAAEAEVADYVAAPREDSDDQVAQPLCRRRDPQGQPGMGQRQ